MTGVQAVNAHSGLALSLLKCRAGGQAVGEKAAVYRYVATVVLAAQKVGLFSRIRHKGLKI